MKFLESVEEVVYKCHIREDENGETEALPKTSEWFGKHKILPRIGDTIIPLEPGPSKKPFYIVHTIIWDTGKNEVIIMLERQLSYKKS